MVNSRKVIISGAGIAGLSAAIALAHQGFEVYIFEQAPLLSEQGAGIQLGPNATAILRHWGLEEALLYRGFLPQSIDLHDGIRAKNLVRLPVKQSAEQSWQAPYVTIHRSDLQNLLHEEIQKNPSISLHCGTKIESYFGSLTNGFEVDIVSNANKQKYSCCLLLACDGVWSTLRQREEGTKSQFSGFVAWRTTVKRQLLSKLEPANTVQAFMGKNGHLILYPIRGGEEFNLVAITRANSQKYEIFETQQAHKQQLMYQFSNWHETLVNLLATINNWTYWPLFTMPHPYFLSPSGVIFLGDSAHASTPFAAQGAAMAIEDACLLAICLQRASSLVKINPEKFPQILEQDGKENCGKNKKSEHFVGGLSGTKNALEFFARERTKRVLKVSRRGNLNRFVYHASGVVAKTRNLYLQNRGAEKFLSDLDWLYGYRAYENKITA